MDYHSADQASAVAVALSLKYPVKERVNNRAPFGFPNVHKNHKLLSKTFFILNKVSHWRH